jgi:formylglycine-generating enzyme required for sulfatase activity
MVEVREFGTNWGRPRGRGQANQDLDEQPVVHLALKDAAAYAAWAGKDLPTGAEWEYAAPGGLDGTELAWGNEFTRDGRHMANTWVHSRRKTLRRMATPDPPVKAFPPNGYGLFDMIGNVWE